MILVRVDRVELFGLALCIHFRPGILCFRAPYTCIDLLLLFDSLVLRASFRRKSLDRVVDQWCGRGQNIDRDFGVEAQFPKRMEIRAFEQHVHDARFIARGQQALQSGHDRL